MKKLLLENLSLKISAVLLSVLLWFFVTSRGQSEISLEIPLEFKDIPSGLVIVNTSPKTVSATVRGQERIMKNLKPSDVRVFVPLDRAKKGEEIYSISKDEVKLPYAMTVTNVSPSSVRIRLDETVSKAVNVKPLLSGDPAEGYYVRAVSADPKNVRIKGLKSDISRIGELKTEVVDISGLNESMEQDIELNTAGFNITADVNAVRLKIVVDRRKR